MTELLPYKVIWENTLRVFVDEEVVPVPSYESWFEPLKVVDYRNGKIFLGAPIKFIQDWVDTTYKNLLKRYLDKVSNGEVTDVALVLLNTNGTYTSENEEELNKEPESKQEILQEAINTEPRRLKLNQKYTFDNFVVGNSNHLAHAAALAVAETPGLSYNPLFFIGGVGLGKTHLMQAIGNFVIENNLRAKVGYFSSETFINEWVNAHRFKNHDEFRKKYRSYDVLLIDDIQFFANKDSCQEEFFHTFNALYQSGSQIIMSSDRYPEDIPGLEERLVSRFSGGLTTEILTPDLETRIAILRNKAVTEKVYIPDDEVFYYIANQVDSNIRVLEGSLNRVIAYAKINQQKIDIHCAEKSLQNFILENKEKPITLELILQVTAQYFKIRPEELKGQKRDNSIAFPRQISMYLARELTDITYKEIGRDFNRDHTTVMFGHDKIAKRMESDVKTKKFVEDIIKQIKKM